MDAAFNGAMIWRESNRSLRLTSGLVVFRAMQQGRASVGRYQCIWPSMWVIGAWRKSGNSITASPHNRSARDPKIKALRKTDEACR